MVDHSKELYMKAKNVSSAREISKEISLEDKLKDTPVELTEQSFMYTLLRIAQKYEILAESNYNLIQEVRKMQDLGFNVKFYQDKQGNIFYQAKEPDKIGFQ